MTDYTRWHHKMKNSQEVAKCLRFTFFYKTNITATDLWHIYERIRVKLRAGRLALVIQVALDEKGRVDRRRYFVGLDSLAVETLLPFGATAVRERGDLPRWQHKQLNIIRTVDITNEFTQTMIPCKEEPCQIRHQSAALNLTASLKQPSILRLACLVTSICVTKTTGACKS